jgi:hypothetical protein
VEYTVKPVWKDSKKNMLVVQHWSKGLFHARDPQKYWAMLIGSVMNNHENFRSHDWKFSVTRILRIDDQNLMIIKMSFRTRRRFVHVVVILSVQIHCHTYTNRIMFERE